MSAPPAPNHTASRHARLDKFSSMEDGWYWDNEGKAPSPKAIEIARSFIDCFGDGAHLYPTLEGGVNIEANVRGHCWEITIGPRGGIDCFHMVLPLAGLDTDTPT